MKKRGSRKKIFVGLSGGVDSSVSLALLQKEGNDVVGVYIRSWFPDWITCDWKEDRRDAMRVCAHLGVPFYELDLEDVYKKEVIDMMISEYKSGRTPNPDVACNREVKFGAFWRWARDHGADAIATGHYAQINDGNLIRGKDSAKDQSYFLWTLTPGDLEHVVFPVGDMEKREVRMLARKFQLPVAEKKDSQGICFLGKVDLKEFLSRYVRTKLGDVLDLSGKKIGTHPGALFFTLGERHGFTVIKKTTHDMPYYIVGKDMKRNTIIVSNDPDKKTSTREIHVSSANQIIPWEIGMKCDAQIRYHGKLYAVKLVSYDSQKKIAEVAFVGEIPLVAPGQSIVFYRGDMCLGGGIVS